MCGILAAAQLAAVTPSLKGSCSSAARLTDLKVTQAALTVTGGVTAAAAACSSCNHLQRVRCETVEQPAKCFV